MARAGMSTVLIILAVVLVSSGAWAIPPALARQYQPLPVDTNVFFVGYSHLTGNTGPDESIPIVKSANIDVNGAAAVYMHYLNAGCNTAYVWASLPGAGVDASVNTTFFGTLARSVSGVGQPVLGFNYGYKGAPAMSPQQFATWRQTTTLNAALYVAPPLGSYDRNRLLNVENNRWEVKPELTWAHRYGKWLTEVYGNMHFFSDNTQFLGSNTLSQNPLFGLDGHFSYDFNPKTWASLDLFQVWGGRVFVNDRTIVSSQSFTTLGFTVSHSVTPTNVVYLLFQKSLSGADENPNFTSVQLLYGRLW